MELGCSDKSLYYVCRYYGDDDFIIRTFDFIAQSDSVHDLQYLIRILMRLVVPDTDSRMTCSKKDSLFLKLHAAARLPHQLPYIHIG